MNVYGILDVKKNLVIIIINIVNSMVKILDRKGLSQCKYSKRKYKEFREEVIKILGGRCIICGESDFRCLQIDHIKGSGHKEKIKVNGYTYYKNILRKIKNNSKDYQLLCANCNWEKRYENKEHSMSKKNKKYSESRLKRLIRRLLGDKCVVCGYQGTALQIDHINRNGKYQNERLTNIKNKILEGNKNYQLLCANHNWIKRYKNKEI